MGGRAGDNHLKAVRVGGAAPKGVKALGGNVTAGSRLSSKTIEKELNEALKEVDITGEELEHDLYKAAMAAGEPRSRSPPSPAKGSSINMSSLKKALSWDEAKATAEVNRSTLRSP